MSEEFIYRNEIDEVLKVVAKKLNFRNSDISCDLTSLKGNGFLGEFFLTKITNTDTNETIELAIKKAFKNEIRRKESNLDTAYYNEIYFYSTIFPTLNLFQKEAGVTKPFDQIPKFYYGTMENTKETVVMENVKKLGYEIRDRHLLLDDMHVKFIFETYGKWHALSFAFKDLHPEEFKKLSANTKDYYELMSARPQFAGFMNSVCGSAFKAIDSEKHPELVQHCKDYFEDSTSKFRSVFEYKGKHSVINHGDCWSNNMMFKYNEDGTLADMKLIDFQLTREGTPVFDLSYFFYTGGSKELFDKLDDYLQIYLDSLKSYAKELGSDASNIFSMEELKQEWKEYSKFGILFSMLLAKIKLLEKKDIDEMTTDDNVENMNNPDADFNKFKIDDSLFYERVSDIIIHAFEIGAL